MRKNQIIIIILAFIFFNFSITDFLSRKDYVYIENNEGSINRVTCTVKKDGSKLLIEKLSSQGISSIEYSLDFKLQKFTHKSAEFNSDYLFSLEQKKLLAKGVTQGKKITENYSLNLPWIQEFTFGLKSFLSSDKREINFYILRPETFELVEMVAIKKVIENIKIDDATYKAQKLKITLPGFKGNFWKAEAWYDIETNNLLKYKANEGPGTPITVITLSAK
jgi:hypothetical protein